MTDLQLEETVHAALVMARKNDSERCVPDYVLAELKEKCVSLSDVQLRRIRDQVQVEW